MELNESLKRFRQEFKLNQRQVAATLEIPYQAYQAYEYGKNIPSAKIIIKLATAYNVSADYLLGISDNSGSYHYEENTIKELTETDKELIAALVASQKSLKLALEKLGITDY